MINNKEIIKSLYSIRSILIQINYKSAECLQLDLNNYSDKAIELVNETIAKVSERPPSNKRWPGTSDDTYKSRVLNKKSPD